MPIVDIVAHIVVVVPYNFLKIVKGRMDNGPHNVKSDLAVFHVLRGMSLLGKLHGLHITEEASDAERYTVNREVTVQTDLRQ